MNIHELLMSKTLAMFKLVAWVRVGMETNVLAYLVDRIRGFHDVSFEFLYLVRGRRR